MAEWLADQMQKIAYKVLYPETETPIKKMYRNLRDKFSVKDKPFVFQVCLAAVCQAEFFLWV